MSNYVEAQITGEVCVKERQTEIHAKDIELLKREVQAQRTRAVNEFIAIFDLMQSRSSVRECFCTILSNEDYMELEKYINNETLWLSEALERVEVYVQIPEEIKQQLERKCK